MASTRLSMISFFLLSLLAFTLPYGSLAQSTVDPALPSSLAPLTSAFTPSPTNLDPSSNPPAAAHPTAIIDSYNSAFPLPTSPSSSPSDLPTSSSSSDSSDDDDSSMLNYYFLLLATVGIIAVIAYCCISRQRRRKLTQHRTNRQNALALDLERWPPVAGRWRVEPRDEEGLGLNERGEAPPPYTMPQIPVASYSAAGNERASTGEGIELRDGVRNKPPGYEEGSSAAKMEERM